MARPQSHPEQHLASPERALARFLNRHPRCEIVVGAAVRQRALADYSKYSVKLLEWKRHVDRLLARVVDPPKLPSSIRKLATLEPPLQFFVKRHEDLMTLVSAVKQLQVLKVGELPAARVITNSRLMMAGQALWVASGLGVSLGPLDFALLEVVARIAEPTSDAGDYSQRQERWRKLMPNIRALSASYKLAWGTFPPTGLRSS